VNSQNETVALATALMQSRQTILPKRLLEPGPDAQQFQLLLEAAASAPDHGQLLPWRFVLVPQNARGRLAAVFVAALQQRDSRASAEQLALAGEKAYRAPLLLLVVVDAGAHYFRWVRNTKHTADGGRYGIWICTDQWQSARC
jgi:nitroreductase